MSNNRSFEFCEPLVTGGSMGVIMGKDPTQFPVPLLLLQISLVCSFTTIFQLLLKPLGVLGFAPHMLGGIILGPSILSHSQKFSSKLFYGRSLILIDCYESLAFLFLIFLITAQMDIGIVKKAGKLAVIIGVSSFIFPYVISTPFSLFLEKTTHSTESRGRTLPMVALLESTTSFHVIFGILSDLKLLNSELGRLALASSMISNFVSFIYFVIIGSVRAYLLKGKIQSFLLSQAFKVALVFIIVLVFRPIMIYMMKRTPEGKPLRSSYMCTIYLMVLLCGLYGELTGQVYTFGPMILGIATPNKPPFGSHLSDTIGCFLWAVLMPCYLLALGRRVNVFLIGRRDIKVVQLLILVARMGKFIGILVPSLYYKMPFSHAISLGLLMNIQGLFDVQIFKHFVILKYLTEAEFSILVITAIIQSMILTVLVRIIYQPTRKYIAYQRRTIQHHRPESELGILACFPEQDKIPLILNILEATNPTKKSPISGYALNLEKLKDSSIPVFIQHRLETTPSLNPKRTDRMVNMFRLYQELNQGIASVHCFTAAAPYETMHDDVCSLALEKTVDLAILAMDRDAGSPFRRVCRSVLENAPCSVAILCDHGGYGGLLDFRSGAMKQQPVQICVVFLGGADDREALAYGARMADHPSVNLRVMRLVDTNKVGIPGDLTERKLDRSAIMQFQARTVNHGNVEMWEETITDASDLIPLLRKIKDQCDLVLVGIKHEDFSPVLEGLSAWSELPEIGLIGDLVSSADLGMRAAVMAVQQQALVVEAMVRCPKVNALGRKSLWSSFLFLF